jgi:hypothetical protein
MTSIEPEQSSSELRARIAVLERDPADAREIDGPRTRHAGTETVLLIEDDAGVGALSERTARHTVRIRPHREHRSRPGCPPAWNRIPPEAVHTRASPRPGARAARCPGGARSASAGIRHLLTGAAHHAGPRSAAVRGVVEARPEHFWPDCCYKDVQQLISNKQVRGWSTLPAHGTSSGRGIASLAVHRNWSMTQ